MIEILDGLGEKIIGQGGGVTTSQNQGTRETVLKLFKRRAPTELRKTHFHIDS